MAANTHKLSVIRDASNPGSEVDYEIYAKGLENARTISLEGDVTGSGTGDLTGNMTLTDVTIGNNKVTTSKIDDSAVTTAKINDKAVTLDKIADTARGGSVQDNDGVLATHSQVKDYVDAVAAGEGKYRGMQTVGTINQWSVTNLNNGDRVITANSGIITFNGQSMPVEASQELVLWKDTSTSPVTAVWQTSEGNYKLKQTEKSDPTASGNTITAIDSITQNTNGEITATKKTIRSASTTQTGVVQLAGSIGATVSTENNKAASEKAVRDAINALDSNATSTDGTNVQVKVTEADGKITAVNVTTDNTIGKVSGATADNFVSFATGGGIKDSGKKAGDFATAAQGGKADAAIQGIKLSGETSVITPDSNKVVTIPYAVAGETGATAGLWSAADKGKLDSVKDGATKVEASATNGNIKIDGVETTVYTHPTTTAVAAAAVKVGKDASGHVVIGSELTKADVGLGNVNNTAITVTTTSVSDGTTKFNQYVHPTNAGNKHVPAGGSSGQFLGYDSAGTAKWVNDPAAGKADVVQNATEGNFAGLNASGNLTDSGKKAADFAEASHAHGNITNSGGITATGVAIANGDSLVIVDASDTNKKLAKASITFDGTTTTKALTPKGTWEEFNGAAPSSALPSMDGTASAGSENAFARGDHVHPTDTSREPAFTINYSASDNALVFSKSFGIVTGGN